MSKAQARRVKVPKDINVSEPVADVAPDNKLQASDIPAPSVGEEQTFQAGPAQDDQQHVHSDRPEALGAAAASAIIQKWPVLPRRVAMKALTVSIRWDLYLLLRQLAMYTQDESMTSIAARAIEKEVTLMLEERGVTLD